MNRVPRDDRACRRAARALVVTCVLAMWVVAWAAEPSGRYLPPAPAAPSDAARAGETGAGEGPDVLLFVFAGRCAIRSCTPPDENFDALAQRLVPAVVAAWRAAGLEVEAWTYRSHVDDHPERGRGYASAVEDLRNAVQDGILRPGSDTRAVLLGYSHGTQFAHLLAFEHPQVPFAASVLLDSICLGGARRARQRQARRLDRRARDRAAARDAPPGVGRAAGSVVRRVDGVGARGGERPLMVASQ